MRKFLPEIITSAAFLLLGVIWLITSFTLPGSTGTNVFGNPRTFPQIIAVIIIIVAAIQLIGQICQSSKGQSKEGQADALSTSLPKKTYINLIALITVTLIYILSVGYLTYLPATVLLLGASMWIFGVRKKGIIITIAVLCPATLLAVFRYLLVVPLP